MYLILRVNGGNLNDSINDEYEKLVKSLISKSEPEQNLRTNEISINKEIKNILKYIDKLAKPIVTNSKVWRVISEGQKPYQDQILNTPEISANQVLNNNPVIKSDLNHDKLSEKEQLIQTLTQHQRSQSKRASKVLGEKYQYSEPELLKNGCHHLKDYGILTQNLTD